MIVKKHFFIFALFLFLNIYGGCLVAQNAKKVEEKHNISQTEKHVIKGVVLDEKNVPLIGVSVIVDGTGNGTITNTEGQFLIDSVDSSSILQVSYIGYTTQYIKAKDKSEIRIIMQEDNLQLEEVVVVGYGTQKKIHMTGAVSQVSGEELKNAPSGPISSVLQGRLPGLISKQTSGAPGGDGANLYVRGTGSGSILYVVDGVQTDYFPNLVVDEIESIAILKDAASQALYGLRGSGGVVLVTTKRGTTDKPTINVNSSFSFSENARFPKLLNGLEFATWYNKAQELDGIPENNLRFTKDEIDKIAHGDPDGVYGNTDWFSLLFNNNAPTLSNTVSLSGKGDRVNYYAMLDAYNQEGRMKKTSYDRYSARINLDLKITNRFSASMSILGRRTEEKNPSASPTSSGYAAILPQAMLSYPFLLPYTANGQPVASLNTDGNGDNNPLAARDLSGRERIRGNTLDVQARLNYDVPFLSGLRVSLDGAYKKSDTNIKSETTPYLVQEYNQEAKTWSEKYSRFRNGGNAAVNQWFTEREIFNIRPEISFGNKIKMHEFGAMLFYEYRRIQDTSMSVGKNGYPIEDIMDINFGEEVNEALIGGGHSLDRQAGYGVRLNYVYADKYMVEFVGRYDASVYLPSESRWGFFPGVSIGWRLSEEPFFKNKFDYFVNNLKIRASYGRLGDDSGMGYTYFSTSSLSKDNSVLFGTKPYKYLGVGGVPNMGLKWPVKDDWNIGVEAMFWNGKLAVELDVFYSLWSRKFDSVADFPPSMGGYYQSTINYGKSDNRGVEVLLSHVNRVGSFNYNIKSNITWARNKVLRYSQDPYRTLYTSAIGKPAGQIWGFIADGIFQSQEEVDESAVFGPTKVGDIKLKDINGDGRITFDQDQVPIGRSNIPELIYSFDLGGEYKGFDFNLFFQGGALFDVELAGTYTNLGFKDDTFYTRPFYAGGNSPKKLLENSWTPENTSAKYPRLRIEERANGGKYSSLYVQNGAYLRLKSAQIGYSLPRDITNLLGVNKVRFYISGSNLFTITGVDFNLDPEMPSVNQGYYPQQRVYEFGLNLTF